jgi:hypothetical protein
MNDRPAKFKYRREYLLSNHGQSRYIWLMECECGFRRGTKGGVCGCCNNAIPSEAESRGETTIVVEP